MVRAKSGEPLILETMSNEWSWAMGHYLSIEGPFFQTAIFPGVLAPAHLELSFVPQSKMGGGDLFQLFEILGEMALVAISELGSQLG